MPCWSNYYYYLCYVASLSIHFQPHYFPNHNFVSVNPVTDLPYPLLKCFGRCQPCYWTDPPHPQRHVLCWNTSVSVNLSSLFHTPTTTACGMASHVEILKHETPPPVAILTPPFGPSLTIPFQLLPSGINNYCDTPTFSPKKVGDEYVSSVLILENVHIGLRLAWTIVWPKSSLSPHHPCYVHLHSQSLTV